MRYLLMTADEHDADSLALIFSHIFYIKNVADYGAFNT